MVMTQDTVDKTRSEFSYVFSRSPHHFSLPLLVRIHQACTHDNNLSPSLLFSLIPNFSIKKKKKIIVVVLFFQKALLGRNIPKKKKILRLFSEKRSSSIAIKDRQSLTRLITRVKNLRIVCCVATNGGVLCC